MTDSHEHRFIVIDDSKIDLFLIEKVIATNHPGAQITKFDRPADALAHVKTNENLPAIIFLDIQMPVMSGFDWLDEFEKLDAHIKQNYTIFILTSSSNPTDYNRGISNPNVKDVLIKPLAHETFVNLPF
ncbi:MAG: two-component system response regulator [Bacteroidota bacterium]|jgi:two-component SAPR family response regulator